MDPEGSSRSDCLCDLSSERLYTVPLTAGPVETGPFTQRGRERERDSTAQTILKDCSFYWEGNNLQGTISIHEVRKSYYYTEQCLLSFSLPLQLTE